MNKKEMKQRLDAVYQNDIRGLFEENGDNIRNPAIEYNRIINELDEDKLIRLEEAKISYDKKQLAIKNRSLKKRQGRIVRRVCSGVLDLIAGYNLDRSLTSAQIDSLKSTFSNIKTYLQDNQPWAAKVLIEAIEPDGILVTQEMKNDVLDELKYSGMPGL